MKPLENCVQLGRFVLGAIQLAKIVERFTAHRRIFFDRNPEFLGLVKAPQGAVAVGEYRVLVDGAGADFVLVRDGTQAAALDQVLTLLDEKSATLARARRHIRLRSLLEVWLFIHVPTTLALIAALAAHIVSVFFFW